MFKKKEKSAQQKTERNVKHSLIACQHLYYQGFSAALQSY